MARPSHQDVLDAVDRLVRETGAAPFFKDVPTALDPPRPKDDPETLLVMSELRDDGRLEITGPGRVARPADA